MSIALIAYLCTLAPSISFKNGGIDGGELALAVTRLGVAHPTGYPVYVLVGAVFTWLPWGDPAFRLNLFSAVAAAAAAALLALAAELACPPEAPPWIKSLAAGAAGLMLAFAPALWSQAVITEVYGLHALFVSANLALLGAAVQPGSPRRQRAMLALGCLTAGLAVAHHITVVLLVPGTLAFLWMSRKRLPSLSSRDFAIGLGLILLGASPYLMLPIRASQQAVANWGDPQTLVNFISHVTAQSYRSMLVQTSTLAALSRLSPAARLLLDQFGWPGLFLISTGGWWLWQRNRPLGAHLALSSALILVQAIHYRARDSEVYLLPLYIMLALALGVGAAVILTTIPEWLAQPRAAQRRRAAGWALRSHFVQAACAAVLVLLPAVSLLQHYPEVDVHGDHTAMDYTREALAALPPDTMLFTNDDRETFSLWYGHYVLGLRPDVTIVDTRLLAWPWYRANLRRLYPAVSWPEDPNPASAVAHVVGAIRPRPAFFTYPDGNFGTVQQGQVFQVTALPNPAASSAP